MFHLSFRYFENHLLDFYEDHNETEENIKQKIIDILSHFAHLSAYLSGNATVNFRNQMGLELTRKEQSN